jgi:hypothetical protein
MVNEDLIAYCRHSLQRSRGLLGARIENPRERSDI